MEDQLQNIPLEFNLQCIQHSTKLYQVPDQNSA